MKRLLKKKKQQTAQEEAQHQAEEAQMKKVLQKSEKETKMSDEEILRMMLERSLDPKNLGPRDETYQEQQLRKAVKESKKQFKQDYGMRLDDDSD